MLLQATLTLKVFAGFKPLRGLLLRGRRGGEGKSEMRKRKGPPHNDYVIWGAL